MTAGNGLGRVTRHNSMLECPRCEETSLDVIGSDVSDDNVGLRRYRCRECRYQYTTAEVFIVDDEGNQDCFVQIALNVRLKNRSNHYMRKGGVPRRQLKASDRLVVSRTERGSVTIAYKRSPRLKAVFFKCVRGHTLNDENTYTYPKTKARTCIPCRRINQRAYLERKRARRLEQEQAA